MIESLQNFAASFPEPLQFLAVALIAAVPLIESYFGSAIGVVIGVPVVAAVATAVVGNVLSMLLFVNSAQDRKSTRLNSSHVKISYAVFCLKKKKKNRR